MNILVLIKDFERINSIENISNKLNLFPSELYKIDLAHIYRLHPLKGTEDILKSIRSINETELSLKTKRIALCETILEGAFKNTNSLVNSQLIEGYFQEELPELLKKNDYDLIVVFPENLNRNSFFISNQLNWIVDNIEVPILILDEKLSDLPFDKVYSLVDSPEAIDEMASSSKLKKIQKMEFLHVGDQSTLGNTSKEVVYVDPVQFDAFVAANQNSLFVIKHKNRGTISSLFKKSFAKKFINSTDNPIVIV